VGADELDRNDSKMVVHVSHQPILVAADIENHPIVRHKTCVTVSAIDGLRIIPIRGLRFGEPCL
jgi:hypothetical protein